MKLHWFSPLPPQRTDIGNFTARLLPALARHATVTLWTPGETWDPALEAHATVRSLAAGDPPWRELNHADAVVYQIGNDGRFHGAIARVARQHPGLQVVHDLSLLQLHLHGADQAQIPEGARAEEIHALAGSAAADLYRQARQAGDTTESIADRLRFPHSLLERAAGIVVHTAENLAWLQAEGFGPAVELPLGYLPSAALNAPRQARPRGVDEPVRLILFGFLHGANRRLLPTLEALASHPRRSRFRLVLAGEYPDRAELLGHLRRLGLESLTELHGFLSEDDLARELDRADLALNLRYPSKGESSGTLLRVWNHSLPCLVTRTAYYAALPETVVGHVDPEREHEDLHRHFDGILDTPETYHARGLAGRQRLESLHSAEAYVEGLLRFLPQARAALAESHARRSLRRLAEQHLAELPEPALQRYWVERAATLVGQWHGLE